MQPLRDVVVVMPGAVKRGTNVVLQCRYDLEGDSLYSVKWYKGRREFFHYTPKEIPPVRTFPAQGVQINVSPIRIWSFSHPNPTSQDERWWLDMQRDAMRCTCTYAVAVVVRGGDVAREIFRRNYKEKYFTVPTRAVLKMHSLDDLLCVPRGMGRVSQTFKRIYLSPPYE